MSALDRSETAEFTQPAMACLAFHDLEVVLGGKIILAQINLEIGKGEFLCVIGPSGCGKTTLLRVAAGLVTASAGAALYEGNPIVGPRRDVAVVFQDYSDALLPWRTAAGNIELVLGAMGVARSERADRIHAALTKVRLQDHAQKFPAQMSGGMQQRLQIARCLAQEPKVWLMDEPFGALDAITRQKLQDEILGIVTETASTVLFVTHDLEEAIYLGDRVIALLPRPGRIAEKHLVPLARPRNQRTTPEQPEFVRLRRSLYDFIERSEA
jgi:NitT/TauT family transport system ATP-binding protein